RSADADPGGWPARDARLGRGGVGEGARGGRLARHASHSRPHAARGRLRRRGGVERTRGARGVPRLGRSVAPARRLEHARNERPRPRARRARRARGARRVDHDGDDGDRDGAGRARARCGRERVPDEAFHARRSPREASHPGRGGGVTSRIRILIVDDAVVVRRMVGDVLGSAPELEVVGTAPSGSIALQKIPQLNPDLVTLDVEMPGMTGIETLVELRKRYPLLPVIMFSTLTERGAATTLDALAAGASDYVTKPANVGSVSAAMQAVRDSLIPKIKTLCWRKS